MGRKRTRVELMPPPKQPLEGSTLTEEKIETLRRCFEAGLNNSQACRLAGISTITLKRAYDKNPKFKEEMESAALEADVMVTNSLLKLATGFVQEVEELKTVSVGDGMSTVEKHNRLAYFQPNVKAAETWLTNRQPEKWKRIQTVNFKNDDLSDEELDNKIAALMAAQSENES